jgi:hypothetical protein
MLESQYKRLIAVACGFLALMVMAIWLTAPPVYKHCYKDEYTDEKKCPSYNVVSFCFVSVGKIFSDNAGTITAVATAFIGLFTLALKNSTDRLWRVSETQRRDTRRAIFANLAVARAAKRSADVAHGEFLASHRPKIFVHAVAVTDKGERASMQYSPTMPETKGKPARGVITLINGGDSAAFVIEWKAIIYYQADDEAFVPHLDTAGVHRPRPDAPAIGPSGQEELGHCQIHAVDRDWDKFASESGRMFFLGTITYEGQDKIRRVTGFCREYDPKVEGAWKIVNKREYEYAY